METSGSKLATEWAGKRDCMSARRMKSTLADKNKFATFALDSVKQTTVHLKNKGEGKGSLRRRHRGTWDPRTPSSTQVKKGQQYTYVETVM